METLNVKTRQVIGKKVQALRDQGEIPAVLYGVGIDPTSISLSVKDFQKIFKIVGETALLSLVVDSNEPKIVLIRDVQRDSLRQVPIHVDFHQVNMNEELDIDVPLEFVGAAPATGSEGGVLVKALHEIPISALPANLPPEIKVDISSLEKIGATIHIRDLKLPQGVKVRLDGELTVAFIEKPISEEELAALEAPAELKVEEVEVVGEKEKKEAEEAAATLEAAEKEK